MKSWEDIAPEPLTFPIRGKSYTVPELSYTAMLTIQKVKAGEASELDGMDADDTWRLVMGDAWDQMVADNVPAEAIGRAGLAALAFFEVGREAAEAIWENGVDPKAMAAAILARTEPQQPTSTGAETETPSPASSSGTSSPKSSSKRSRPAKASPS